MKINKLKEIWAIMNGCKGSEPEYSIESQTIYVVMSQSNNKDVSVIHNCYMNKGAAIKYIEKLIKHNTDKNAV